MKLTISNESNGLILSVDISESMTLQDFKAYLEAETDIEPANQILIFNSKTITGDSKTLKDVGFKDEDLILLRTKATASNTGVSSEGQSSSINSGLVENQIEQMRQQFLTDSNAAAQLRNSNPDLHAALNNPSQFSSLMKESLQQFQNGNLPGNLNQQQQQEIARLEQDPDNAENQAKILEIIRQEQIQKNLDLAYDITPEAFTSVSMLYIKIEVNHQPVQAFVDSGAQQTIISPRLAEKVGIDRLIDRRFVGEARGVGSSKILGKIHSVPISIGNSTIEIPCSFYVIDTSVDLLFGLDMLKRHKCLIDLANNKLVVGSNIETPFLADHEIENNDLLGSTVGGGNQNSNLGFGGNIFSDMTIPTNNNRKSAAPASTAAASAAVKRQNLGTSSSTGSGPTAGSFSSANKYKDADIQQLMGLGFSRAEVIKALDACDGNVEIAASFLFQ